MNENLEPELPVQKPSDEIKAQETAPIEAVEANNVSPVEQAETNKEAELTEKVESTEKEHAIESNDSAEDVVPIEKAHLETAKAATDTKSEDINQPEQSEAIAEAPATKHISLTKDEILEKLKNLASQKELPSRAEVESLKQAFYKLRSAAVEAEKAKFIEDGNEAEAFTPSADPSEDVVKTFLQEVKEKRAQHAIADERVKEENYNKKLRIIDSIKNLTESSDDFNKLYKEFKDLQQEWNEITLIPQTKMKELWKSYQIYTEKFYDLIKINNEFRDYDFKKNLELKNSIIEAVEKLTEEADPVSAFHQLQNFHQQWREIGPVARELREEIWTKFKDASTAINKEYQTHFESLKGKEEENLAEKTAICETLKAIDYSTLTSFK